MDHFEPKTSDTPAQDAAGLLLRIGFGILVLVAPFAALFWRRAFVILVPIGALLIVCATLLVDPKGYIDRVRAMLVSPIGLVVGCFAAWIVASLLWTPFPGPASERAFRTIGNALMAGMVCAALPTRMRSSNLNLMIIGIALASAALVIGSILGSAAPNIVNIAEGPNVARAAIAASVLVWPALCWTMTRGRDIEGLLLIAACGIAAIASASLAAAIVLFTALMVFLIARSRPTASATALGWFWGILILGAPALAFAARSIAALAGLGPGHLLSQIGLWTNVINQQPIRLLTGHGFDTAHRARAAGIVDPQAPLGLLPELWHDFGVVGAAALALIVIHAFRALARAPGYVGASALALLSALLVFLVIDPTATQQWWLSVSVVAAITMTAVHHGQYRTRRPSATLSWLRLGISNS